MISNETIPIQDYRIVVLPVNHLESLACRVFSADANYTLPDAYMYQAIPTTFPLSNCYTAVIGTDWDTAEGVPVSSKINCSWHIVARREGPLKEVRYSLRNHETGEIRDIEYGTWHDAVLYTTWEEYDQAKDEFNVLLRQVLQADRSTPKSLGGREASEALAGTYVTSDDAQEADRLYAMSKEILDEIIEKTLADAHLGYAKHMLRKAISRHNDASHVAKRKPLILTVE